MTAKVSQTLYWRLSMTLFVVFLVVALFSAGMMLRSSNIHQQQIVQTMHQDLAEHVAKHYLFFENGEVNLEAAKNTFHDLMILGPNFEFYVLDIEGNLLAYSAKPDKIKRRSVDVGPVKSFIERPSLTSPIYGQNPRSFEKDKVFTAAPIKQEGNLVGYLYVVLGSEIYDGIADLVFDSKILQWGLWIVGAGLLFTFIATLLLLGVVTRPLHRLTRQVQKLRDEGFSSVGPKTSVTVAQQDLIEWSSGSSNEIHVLGSAFRQLLDKLEEQYAHVITVDELRKELLTHISHDLRTPLASLLGYLETWEMNSENMEKKESDKYIAIARKSAKKISHLVEQLFELAHLDSGTVQVNIERFSLAELVQDVIQKFSIQAEEKNITLDITPKDSSIVVSGDIEKLERVFSNLIENALRHTTEGGRIAVRLSPGKQTVAVEVSDDGIGIPPQDLPHVFDAHFKAENSVRGNSSHGGIGLAITKKIIDLHQSTIDVSSQVNKGTTFRFMLPAV